MCLRAKSRERTIEQDIRGGRHNGSTPAVPLRLPYRAIIGLTIGGTVGALAGHLIDTMLTDEPYACFRIGLFLGGLLGGQIGGENGLAGIAVTLIMVGCSAIGVAAPMAACSIWRPLPMDHWLVVITTFAGAVGGALIGLTVSAIAFDPRLKRWPAQGPKDGEA